MKNKEIKSIYFTDRELYYVALAFESLLNSRDTWLNSQGAKVVNRALQKIEKSGMLRENPKAALHPIIDFESND